MKIEVWSDYVCPFCYIGKRTLEQALENFPHKDEVQVSYKAFQLDPNTKSDENISVHEALANKYEISVDEAKAMNNQLVARAAEVGLTYNFDQVKQTNTLDAHRLAKYAETKGKGKEMAERLMKGYFTESKFLGKLDTLIELAVEAGLDREETETVLKTGGFAASVQEDQAEAAKLQVQGVPFFVINRKYAISGAQPVTAFADTLQKVWEEENKAAPLQQIDTGQGAVCTDDHCDIPGSKNE